MKGRGDRRFVIGGAAVHALLLSCLPLVGCTPPEAGVLADYSGGEVRSADLEAALRRMPEGARQPEPGVDASEWLTGQLRDVALRQILLQRAEQAGLSSDKALRFRWRLAGSEAISKAYVSARCADGGAAAADSASPDAVPPPSEWILLRHIYKTLPPQASREERQQTREALEEIRRSIETGANFAETARLHSDSETASAGGLIGRISRQAPIDEAVRTVVWSLRDGQISQIVEVSNGFHLFLRETSGVESNGALARPSPAALDASRQTAMGCASDLIRDAMDRFNISVADESVLRSEDGTASALTVNDERITLAELRSLVGSRDQISAQLLQMAQRVAETMALELAARESFEPGDNARWDELAEQRWQESLIAAQWELERQRWLDEKPEDEWLRLWEGNRHLFVSELTIDTALIVIVDRASRRGAWEAMRAVRSRLEQGESFEDLAAEVSTHPSAAHGGQLGWMAWSEFEALLGPHTRQAVLNLNPAEVSGPFELTADGRAWAIVKVLQREEPRPLDFEESREALRDFALTSRVQQNRAEIVEGILEEVQLEIHPTALDHYLRSLDEDTTEAPS